MYDFIDLNEEHIQQLPSVFMAINGKVLEYEIPGYRTLNVMGRELIGKDIDSETIKGRNGALVRGSQLPARTITVEYQLKADSNETFRLAFERLNYLIGGEESELWFSDDRDYTFTGELSSVDEVPKGRNDIIASYSFYCADPFKYSKPMEFEGKEIELAMPLYYPVVPDVIEIIPSNDTQALRVESGGLVISLSGNFATGEPVVIDIPNQEVWQHNAVNMEILDLQSDFENFQISTSGTLKLVQNGSMRLVFRGAML